jgi:two-component system OmpR family response regulator
LPFGDDLEPPFNILIVDDEAEAAGRIADALKRNGMHAAAVRNDTSIRKMLKHRDFDLLIVSGDASSALCRSVRSYSLIPIMLLVTTYDDAVVVDGLEAGADDCLPRTATTREMLARARALIRRATHTRGIASGSQSSMTFRGWRIDPLTRRLWNPAGVIVPLTGAEFDLLLAFCRNPGVVVTRRQLLASMHIGRASPVERSIDVHVSRLRRKIDRDSVNPLISTVRLGGYILSATVVVKPPE